MQALRAVAVLMVLLFHLWPDAVSGGYAGVDVFFVISGFLITGHLLREHATTGTIALHMFWARRIARLLPAALLVLSTTLLAAWAWLPATRWAQLAAEVAASVLQLENWWLATQATDYFASQQAASAVQHYWSLSVEEQFYLAWPLLILLAARRRTSVSRSVALALAVVIAASLAWSAYATAVSPATAYFSTWARAWEFAAGGLLAVWRARAPAGGPAAPRIALSWAGFLGLGATGVMLDGNTPFPGTAAMLPVLATLAVIAAGTPVGTASPAPLLRLRPVQWLGHVAYPVYLWHWPLAVLAPHALRSEPGNAGRVAILIATLALAWLTSITVEHRFRPNAVSGRRVRTLYVSAAAASALVLAAAFALWRAGDALVAVGSALQPAGHCRGAAAMRPGAGCPDRFRAAPAAAPTAAQQDGGARWMVLRSREDPWFTRDCRFEGKKTHSCQLSRIREPSLRLVLAGDSHLLQYLPAIAVLAKANRWNVDYYMSLGCPVAIPTRGFAGEPSLSPECHDWRARVPDQITARADVDLVLTTASTRRFARELTRERQRALAEAFTETWQAWTAAGKRTLVIVDNPLSTTADGRHVPVPDCLAAAAGVDDACAVPRRLALPRDPVDMALAHAPPGVSGLDLNWAFCDATTCHFTVGGMVTHLDANHVTASFNLTLAPEIGRAILRAAGRDPASLVLPDDED